MQEKSPFAELTRNYEVQQESVTSSVYPTLLGSILQKSVQATIDCLNVNYLRFTFDTFFLKLKK